MEQGQKEHSKTPAFEDRYMCEYRKTKITEMIDTIDSIVNSSPEAKPMEVVYTDSDSIVDDCRRDTSTYFRDTRLTLKKAVSIIKDIVINGKKTHAKAVFGIPEWNEKWELTGTSPSADMRYFSLKLPGQNKTEMEHYFIVGEDKKIVNPLASYEAHITQDGRKMWEIFAEHVANAEPLLNIIKQFAD